MPFEIWSYSSLSYFLYCLIGMGGIWIACKVAREKVVDSPGTRSLLALIPLLFPILVLIWVRPDFSHVVPHIGSLSTVLGRLLGPAFGPLREWGPGILSTYLGIEIGIIRLVSQFSALILILGVGVGSMMAIVFHFFGVAIVKRVQGTIPIEEHEIPEVQEIVRKLAKRAGVPGPTILLTEDLRPDAYTLGSGKSANLVLSAGLLASAAADELEAVIAHEMIHIKNRDNQMKILLGLLRFLAFYNPVAHVAAAEVIKERELDADSGAIGLLGQSRSLIKGLEFAQKKPCVSARRGFVSAFSSLFSSSSFLSHHPAPEERMQAVGGRGGLSRGRRMMWGTIAILLAALALLLPVEAARVMGGRAFSPSMVIGHHQRLDPTRIPIPPPVEVRRVVLKTGTVRGKMTRREATGLPLISAPHALTVAPRPSEESLPEPWGLPDGWGRMHVLRLLGFATNLLRNIYQIS